MTRFAVAWGDPPGMGDHPERWLCVACHHELPTVAAVQCGECAHAWRWEWILSLHDAWLTWRLGGWLADGWGTPAPWWRLDRLHTRIRIRRPSKIWVCPCCSHDL